MYGVGFVVRGNLRDSVMGWISVSKMIKQQRDVRKDDFYDELDARFCPVQSI